MFGFIYDKGSVKGSGLVSKSEMWYDGQGDPSQSITHLL